MNDSADLAPYALVVDDDATILYGAVALLEEAGFHTLDAYNANEALGCLEEHGDNIVLLFTDVEMPGPLNGFELARRVAKRWPNISILLASATAKPEDSNIPAGAIFVRKPFSIDVVHDRINELLPNGKKPKPLNQKAP